MMTRINLVNIECNGHLGEVIEQKKKQNADKCEIVFRVWASSPIFESNTDSFSLKYAQK